MIEVSDLTNDEIDAVLNEVGFGHLGCSLNEVPYVIPVHYVYQEHTVYLYTTEGKKTDIIDENPNVCLQVESVTSNRDWRSVIVTGVATRVTDPAERERIVKAVAERDPTFTPAVSIHWIDDWVRENREVVYRVEISSVTGRASDNGRNYPIVHQVKL